ncbi:MAG TPA: hypothetical protein VM290_00645 [Gaiellaceae bacterium]|nr:hypothetical protein [Gaiellaceae bacterium]
MSTRRQELRQLLEAYYRGCGWKVETADDGTVRAAGLGGVTWIGLPVVADDLADPDFPDRLRELGAQRMPQGQLCPLELLPDEGCADELRSLLDEVGLRERGHVEVYAVAA